MAYGFLCSGRCWPELEYRTFLHGNLNTNYLALLSVRLSLSALAECRYPKYLVISDWKQFYFVVCYCLLPLAAMLDAHPQQSSGYCSLFSEHHLHGRHTPSILVQVSWRVTLDTRVLVPWRCTLDLVALHLQKPPAQYEVGVWGMLQALNSI